MSLTSSLERIVQAKADIKTAIENKGVTIGSDVSIANYDDYIDAIQTGSSTPTQTKTVALSMASGDQVITPDTGYALSQVTVEKPSTLTAENIKSGVSIGGVTGSYAGGGGSTLVIPLVSNIALDGATLSWDAPDITTISDLSQYDPEFDYLVIINEGLNYEQRYITTQTSIDVFSLFTGGAGATYTISVYAILKLTNDTDTEKTNVLYPYSATSEIGLSAYLPAASRGMGIGTVGTDIYLFGGNTTGNTNLNTILKFDTTNESISTLNTTLPYNMYGMGVGVNGTDIYLFGGWSSSAQSLVQKFDTTTNTLTTLNITLPVGMSNMGYATVGTNVYLFGGYLATGYGSDIYKFNMTTETFSKLTPTLPHSIFDLGAIAVGTDIYLFGGITQYSSMDYKSILRFDTTTETLTTMSTEMTESQLRAPACASIGDDMFIIGGQYSSSTYTRTIRRFKAPDSLSNLASRIKQESRGIVAATVGNTLYYFGGMYGSYYYTTIGKITKRIQ